MKKKIAIRKLERMTKQALKKQSQEGLSKIFSKLSCKGVAKEIKAGRNVTGNVEYGIRLCVHDRIGPRVNVKTLRFYPMTAKAKSIERKFVKNVNLLLKNGGFRPMSSGLIAKFAKSDVAFKKRVAKRRKEIKR